MSQVIWVDGELVPAERAVVSVYDHGLLYGDGIFEGVRAYDGNVFQLDQHLDRLNRSAACLRIALPERAELVDAVLRTLRGNALTNAYVRLVVTRGRGRIGPNPATCPTPSVIIIAEPTRPAHGESAAASGLSVAIVPTRRDPVDATTHQIKSLNYLNSVLATMEATAFGADDAIMLDSRGFVSESAICNVFVARGGELATPSEASGILRGITRDVVMSLAGPLGLTVIERDITSYELRTADELFLTGTHAELVPVVSVNGAPIGAGVPGATFTALRDRFRSVTVEPDWGTPIG